MKGYSNNIKINLKICKLVETIIIKMKIIYNENQVWDNFKNQINIFFPLTKCNNQPYFNNI